MSVPGSYEPECLTVLLSPHRDPGATVKRLLVDCCSGCEPSSDLMLHKAANEALPHLHNMQGR